MKVAVVEMPTVLAQVEHNMKTAENYIEKAAKEGAELIVFPEFFTTGFAFCEAIWDAIIASETVEDTMQNWSTKYQIAVGGSYLWYDESKEETYNKFGLFFPNGEQFFHKKDIPTAIENYCYTKGDDNRVFETPLGKIGIAMCWEQLRYDTLRDMKEKVDFVIGGSCWWGFAKEDGKLMYHMLEKSNRRLAQQIPYVLSDTLGVPFIHASHGVSFEGGTLKDMHVTCVRKINGDALILDGTGKKLISANQNAGVYFADIMPGSLKTKVELPENEYWVKKLPTMLEKGFYMLNENYSKYYEKVTKEEIRKRLQKI